MNEYKVVSRMTSWQKSYPNWVSIVSILCLLAIWELICQSGVVSSLFLPAPTAIISALLQMIADGEIGVSLAASLYRKTSMGQNWGYKKDNIGNILTDDNGKKIIDPKADVRQLPNGAGYLYMRNALKEMIGMFRPLCDTLILVCHVKDKQIKKNDEETTEMAVDLAGKTGDIICGEADAIGYVYRHENKTLLTFAGGDNNIRGSRPLHLREKTFEVAVSDDEGNLTVDMSQIFLPVEQA